MTAKIRFQARFPQLIAGEVNETGVRRCVAPLSGEGALGRAFRAGREAE
ncbi:hypothetical protein W911_04425 [Hyphomicrobium nitrativorans NL23]|uniref:Uncharacterized protein n=1 Tax=Hyphomicrobium nitrativorans NL23 TaxID=1029756 RepID=V5SIN4_9HYPH|nr:hypothetical protein W911_04425 [Hyphomicrobium nitrativorans NL23]